MNRNSFFRISGAAAILAAVSTIGGTIVEVNPASNQEWIYFVSTLATVLALSGIYFLQKDAAGTLGLIGFLVALAGNLLLFIPDPVIGGSVYALGLVILGIAIIRGKVFASWIGWLWIISPILALPGFALPNLQSVLFLTGAIVSALGFLGAGIALLRSGASSVVKTHPSG